MSNSHRERAALRSDRAPKMSTDWHASCLMKGSEELLCGPMCSKHY